MNESTLTQLRLIVERRRPIRSGHHIPQAKMRKELLAHVSAFFEEELATLDDEEAARLSID